jgi:hypothetical protein
MKAKTMRTIECLSFALFTIAAYAATEPGKSCESLAKLALPATTIATVETITGGSFTPPGGKPIDHLPAFCRVTGVIHPSSDSNIDFEVWLPASGWNHKFQGIGNGGFAGSINYGQGGLTSAISHRYAAAATNTGHDYYDYSLLHWTSDGRALTYPLLDGDSMNLWRQPLTGGPPQQITHFNELIYAYDWSPDGKRLAISRGRTPSDVVLISNFRE